MVADQPEGQGYGMTLDDVEEWLNGKAVVMYRITALMKVRPFPAPSGEQRHRFEESIGALLSRVIMQPNVQWIGDTQARVTLAAGGENATTAGQRAREITDRNAANMAHLYVTGIDLERVEPREM
jgi:hypothetical protein